MAKTIRIYMPNGAQFDIPAEIVAEHRAKYYATMDAEKAQNPDPIIESLVDPQKEIVLTTAIEDDPVYQKTYADELAIAHRNDRELIRYLLQSMNWPDLSRVAVRVVEESIDPEWDRLFLKSSATIIE